MTRQSELEKVLKRKCAEKLPGWNMHKTENMGQIDMVGKCAATC